MLALADPETPCLGGGSSPELPGRAQSAGPLLAGASASDRIWHSEKIRFACKFSLRSAREGFAGFGALCLPAAPRCSWLAAVPWLCPALSTQLTPILPEIAPKSPSSESRGSHLPAEGKKGMGWGFLLFFFF